MSSLHGVQALVSSAKSPGVRTEFLSANNEEITRQKLNKKGSEALHEWLGLSRSGESEGTDKAMANYLIMPYATNNQDPAPGSRCLD
ncbi:hypothetical protein PoB_006887900 [Plakobranchus ocellatus]|uniref:Uncharacterized protein n=1 Tax=Plakobranchus ocellatus TaxID=259542 RepID=A0AAV4DE13_9GAST|nr:hypothetical protein PoB_006887900 [Plakobranchus ocellatus]